MGAVSRRIWRWLGITLCACCFAIAASGRWEPTVQQEPAQSPPETPPFFRAEHNEVEVVVIVRDSKGRAVGNLEPSDLEIRDNGKRQSIISFSIQGVRQPDTAPQSRSTQPPLAAASAAGTRRGFVALFFDDVHTEPADFGRVQEAAKQFVLEGLPTEDRVAIFKASENGVVTFTN